MPQLEFRSFVLRQQDGTIIEPWKNVKDLHGYEWLMNSDSALLGETRTIESATYTTIEKGREVIIPSAKPQPETVKVDFAVFYSNIDSSRYEIAERLVPRSIKLRDEDVVLEILGCCNIISIKSGKDKKK